MSGGRRTFLKATGAGSVAGGLGGARPAAAFVTYVTGDFGGATFRGVDMERAIEAFARLPRGQKLYLRPAWRELQKRPGRLGPDEYGRVTLAMAKQYGRRVGFRVMLSSPDLVEPALPDFVLDQVPMAPP